MDNPFAKLAVPSANDQPALWWVIRAVLIVYAGVVASNLPENVAAAFDHVAVRLVTALLVVFLSLHDPASAILLAVGFVVSVQTYNQHHIARVANDAVTAEAAYEAAAKATPAANESFANGEEQLAAEEGGVRAEQADHVTQSSDATFTSPSHLYDAQSNAVSDNQNTQVQTWKEELGPQGLASPGGVSGAVPESWAPALDGPTAPVQQRV